MTHATPEQHIRNMWLAGCTRQDVVKSLTYQSLHHDQKFMVWNDWETTEAIFLTICQHYGIDYVNPCDVTRARIKGNRHE